MSQEQRNVTGIEMNFLEFPIGIKFILWEICITCVVTFNPLALPQATSKNMKIVLLAKV